MIHREVVASNLKRAITADSAQQLSFNISINIEYDCVLMQSAQLDIYIRVICERLNIELTIFISPANHFCHEKNINIFVVKIF